MATLKPAPDQSSWSELIGGIVTDVTRLVGKEIELAKLEIRGELMSAKALVVGVLIGGLIALMGAALLTVALTLALFAYTTLPQWACFALVGGALLVAGTCIVVIAKNRKLSLDLIPERTAETIKEDIQWINSSIRTASTIRKNANKPAANWRKN